MIEAVEPEGPYLLGGLCHAGLIAFEVARQLERKGQKVGVVAMIAPPAWNPPHWRWLKDSMETVAGLCNADRERATDFFLACRQRRMQARQFWEYLTLWFRETASVGLAARLAGTLRVGKRLVSGAVVKEKPWVAEPLVALPAGGDLMTTYRRAVASYVRRPYAGRVAIYWPAEVPVNTLGGSPLKWDRASDPSLGWRRIARDVEVHRLPGDYTTTITKYAHVLATRLRASVQDVKSGKGDDAPGRLSAVPADVRPTASH
jgi:thioesterase domain-containing protein